MLSRRVLLLVVVAFVALGLGSVALAAPASGLGAISAAIADAASEAETGVLPAMVGFFGFLVTLGFAWAIVRSLRG